MPEHDHIADSIKWLLDLLSIGIVMGTLASLLPPMAALLTAIYTVIRIYETNTVQRWLKRDAAAPTPAILDHEKETRP